MALLVPHAYHQARAEVSQEGTKIPSDRPSPSHLQAFQGLHSPPASITCVLVTQLLTGISGPLSTEVSHPGGRGIDLVVQGQLSWVKPVRDVQVAPLAHNEAAAWGEWGKKHVRQVWKSQRKNPKCAFWPNIRTLHSSGAAAVMITSAK